MSTCRLAAPAKINLTLEVTGRDSAGYHLLETIFATLDLHDEVTVRLTDSPGITLSCSQTDIPTDATNLAWQAAECYLNRRPDLGGVDIDLLKRIPAGGGLGGGSSNAAAVLRALAQLDTKPLPNDELSQIAANLGADVAFFLIGGCAHGSGRGEILTPLDDLPQQPITLLFPGIHCSTPTVFKALTEDERGPRTVHGADHWQQHLKSHSKDLSPCLHNRLTAAAERSYPALTSILDSCRASGLPWQLSGSGATVFVLGKLSDPPAGTTALMTGFRSRERLDTVG